MTARILRSESEVDLLILIPVPRPPLPTPPLGEGEWETGDPRFRLAGGETGLAGDAGVCVTVLCELVRDTPRGEAIVLNELVLEIPGDLVALMILVDLKTERRHRSLTSLPSLKRMSLW